ncbi:hypothetical protein ACFSJY_18730 [Thalassotalea euphylliae]|uniref:hypothetical protein n=1 Tax=Thalassotalea euphylliae TaxID=1655234 RepID=UPI003627FDA5
MDYQQIVKLEIGDELSIDNNKHGKVLANIESGKFSEAYRKEDWEYLQSGLLIYTDFGGVIHYSSEQLTTENFNTKNQK